MASVLELILRTKKQGTGAKDTSKDLMGLEKLAKKVGVAFAAMAAAKVIKNATLLAARVETLGVVTKTLGATAGMTEKEIRSLERAIEDQGITLRSSRQSIAMMIQANVDLAYATDLARLAQNTAVIANLNSSESFQQLIYVLQTGNVRMARTLGLNVQFGNAQKELAKTLGKTTQELTEQEIMQARTNAVIKAGIPIANVYAEAMGTAGKTLLSMPRQIEAISLAFGKMFMPAFEEAVGVVYELTKTMAEGTVLHEEFAAAQEYLGEASNEVNAELEEQGIITEGIWGWTDEYKLALIELANEMRMGVTHADELMLRLAGIEAISPEVEVKIVGQDEFVDELDTLAKVISAWSRQAEKDAFIRARISMNLDPLEGQQLGGGDVRAGGGPVSAGQAYVVGEREAELFVPNQAGHVYNQNQLAGGDVNINNGISQRAFNNMAEDFFRGLGG